MQRSQSQCRGGCANGTSRAPLRPACFAHANVVATSVLDRSCRACGAARLILAWSSGPSAFSCLSGFVQCCAATWARSRAASSDILSRCTGLHPAEPAPPSNTARQRHKYSSSRRRTVAAGVAPGVTHSGRRSPPRHTWRASRKRYTLPTSTATCSITIGRIGRGPWTWRCTCIPPHLQCAVKSRLTWRCASAHRMMHAKGPHPCAQGP